MKLLKIGRNLVAGRLAWNYVQSRIRAAEHARRRRNWTVGLAFGTGAALAYTFREDLVAMFHKFVADRRREDWNSAPSSGVRQETGEMRSRSAESQRPSRARKEPNASPGLSEMPGDTAKH